MIKKLLSDIKELLKIGRITPSPRLGFRPCGKRRCSCGLLDDRVVCWFGLVRTNLLLSKCRWLSTGSRGSWGPICGVCIVRATEK